MRQLLLAAAATAAFIIPSAAQASITITGETGNPGWLTAQIKYAAGGIGGKPSATALNVYAGRNHLTGYDSDTLAAVSFDSYCIDIFNQLKANNAEFELGAFSLADATKKADLYTLLLSSANDIANESNTTRKQRIAAAIQLSIWEIINEASGTPYSIGTGNFSVSSTYGSATNGTASNPSAFNLAQAYLDGLPTATIPAGNRLRTLEAVNPVSNQRQVFIAAVPEPATWSMLIMGFGIIGGAMRGRRRTTLSFA